ncbi:MAG: hypothetical protein ACLFR0_06355 [Alphaproteobacteria bacterium]
MHNLKAFLLAVIISLSFSAGAIAQELNTTEACTTPRGDVVSDYDERWVYCDIHMRQFEHRERMIELQESLSARAEAFKASTKPVIDNYKAELERYHANLGSE